MSTITRDVPLAPYTTFGIGGEAEYFCEASTVTELTSALTEARDRGWPITVLGGGSNVLVSDDGIKGLVVRNVIKGTKFTEGGEQVVLEVGAGEVFDEVVEATVTKGYWGLENLSLIPGSVGAVPIQNVGAYGVEAKELVRTVEAVSLTTGAVRTFTNEECLFDYRDSYFKSAEGKDWVITKVVFTLRTLPNPKITYKDLAEYFKETTPAIEDIRKAVISIRNGKFPDWHVLGTAGSFFKNPIVERKVAEALVEKYPDLPHFPTNDGRVKLSLSWLLDHVLDVKGERVGKVGTYKEHVLVMVNHGEATAKELSEYATSIEDRLREKTGLSIEWEVTPLLGKKLLQK